jgi:hypothetical protein
MWIEFKHILFAQICKKEKTQVKQSYDAPFLVGFELLFYSVVFCGPWFWVCLFFGSF